MHQTYRIDSFFLSLPLTSGSTPLREENVYGDVRDDDDDDDGEKLSKQAFSHAHQFTV